MQSSARSAHHLKERGLSLGIGGKKAIQYYPEAEREARRHGVPNLK
jgi:hypothetical protein